MAHSGEYLYGGNADNNSAQDYSANYATGHEMVDLNARRKAALAEVRIPTH
jgi:hypothetical protein